MAFSPGRGRRERERERERDRAGGEGRAHRFAPSPLLAPPMSHLILLPTAKSTPLTHTPRQNTAADRPSATRSDCVPLGGISALYRIVRKQNSLKKISVAIVVYVLARYTTRHEFSFHLKHHNRTKLEWALGRAHTFAYHKIGH